MSSLTDWLQTTLTNNLNQTDEDSEDTTSSTTNDISLAFSPNAQIFWNHEPISIDEFKQRTSSNNFRKGSKVDWKDVFEVPDSENEGNGIVAGYIVATHYSKLRIRATPAQSQSLITLSAKIEKDQDNEDQKRIVHMFYTTVDKAVPVHFHGVVKED